MPATADDHALANHLAEETGRRLIELRQQLVSDGSSHWELKDAGDLAAHRFIVETLNRERPDDAVLSEEGADQRDRLDAERIWIVDPLDGTREFGEPPRIDWAVHIALVEGGVPVAGAVALPAENTVLSTEPAPELPAPAGEQPRVIVSRTRRPPAAQMLARELDAEYIEMGSAGAKAMAVVRGMADIYAHSGGQYEWDSCAPVAVATAAGLHCSRLDGSPMLYNNPDPYLPDLLICRPEWAEPSLKILNR
ncbi:MAG: 3'(2'),5'-bisphosphate nucleotidase CysQ [Actinomycetia bacterium]|nr:3'(2'),5'-bisphosphate nucleotidase CysQ [Actinomycetes bacterium]MCP4226654.1 3'(2'),5'-bisphosphate nucleotidase CysQ [Actinomycetes bacterium]